MPDRYFPKIAVDIMLVKGTDVFLLQRAKHRTLGGYWAVPGGHIQPGESLKQAAIRETKEEVGVTIVPAELKLLSVVNNRFPSESADWVYCFFITSTWDGEPNNREPEKCSAADWFSIKRLPEPIMPYLSKAIESLTDGVVYREIGFS